MTQLYTAKEAAARLGRPRLARTFARRAAEAYYEGDPAIQRIADRWAADLAWWESQMPLRRPGRKRRDSAHTIE